MRFIRPGLIALALSVGAGTSARNGLEGRIIQFGPITTDAPPSPMVFAVHRPMTGPVFHSPPEPLLLMNPADPSGAWTGTTPAPWLTVSPESGAGPGVATLSLNAAVIAGMAGGTYTSTVDFVSAMAPMDPTQVGVVLRVTPAPGSADAGPIGVLDTPPAGATGLSRAIPVTGWALDDVGITGVHIYRAAVGGEPPGSVFIGNAVRVRGLRPDLTISHPNLPEVRSGGWGLMVLSNMLPNGGNGTFTFRAYVNGGKALEAS